MRRVQYVMGLTVLALVAASVGYAQGRGDAQGGRAGAAPAAAAAAAPARPMPAILQNYAAVIEARLKNPEDNNWLLLRRTYNGWGLHPTEADHDRQREPPEVRLVVLDRPSARTGREAWTFAIE